MDEDSDSSLTQASAAEEISEPDPGYLESKPKGYVGRHSKAGISQDAGEDTQLNISSADPVAFLLIETVQGLGDSVLAVSMSFKAAVRYAKEFASAIEGEIGPERIFMPEAGTVRMRTSDGISTPYRIEPMRLL